MSHRFGQPCSLTIYRVHHVAPGMLFLHLTLVTAFVSCPRELTLRVWCLQADRVEESGSDSEDGSTSASDDETGLEGDEGQAARRSSATQKAKAALEQLQGEPCALAGSLSRSPDVAVLLTTQHRSLSTADHAPSTVQRALTDICAAARSVKIRLWTCVAPYVVTLPNMQRARLAESIPGAPQAPMIRSSPRRGFSPCHS